MLNGLPAGEYRVGARMVLAKTATDQVFGGSYSSSSHGGFSLTYFYGDTFQQSHAKLVKLTESAQDRLGMTIPLSKLHAISGALLEAGSAHVINSGRVALIDEDKRTLCTAMVDAEDGQFRLEFVPEGNYTLKVRSAADVTREPGNPAAPLSAFNVKEIAIKNYGDYEAPLLVQSEVTGLNLDIPPRAPADKSKAHN